MVWQPEVNDIALRRKKALQMGGPEGVERQHARGHLTVRERITSLVDANSFEEIGPIAGTETYDGNHLTDFTPASSIIGACSIGGHRSIISCGDWTIRGGAGGLGSKAVYAQKLALNWKLPLVRLLESGGGSVKGAENLGRTYLPNMSDSPSWLEASHLLGVAPVVSAVMGSVAGGPAIESCMAHFNLMVKDTTQVFVAGPPVVKAALGIDISKEELGNDRVHCKKAA